MRVLVVNAGSSSLKLAVVEGGSALEAVEVAPGDLAAVDRLADRRDLGAVGHRVVHGGPRFVDPVRLDDAVVADLEAVSDLAPLHNPPTLAAVAHLRAERPDLPQVACFDTAFHASMPEAATTYALPAELNERFGLRRYGFQGLSHAWAARRGAELLGGRRLVTAHLGSGASLAAVLDGVSVDTTMGFTPSEGLVMATRSGSVDPGLVLWLEAHGVEGLDDVLNRRSGLLGLAGTADLRQVLAGVDAGDERCVLAYGVYVHRLATSIGAMAAAMGGIDGLVFTGGAGERSHRLRADACATLGHLGLAVELEIAPDAVIGPKVAVVAAREDLEIARLTEALVAPGVT